MERIISTDSLAMDGAKSRGFNLEGMNECGLRR